MEVMVSGLSFISPNTERPLKGEEIAEQGIIRRLFHERTVELNALWYRREDVMSAKHEFKRLAEEAAAGERRRRRKKTRDITDGILHIYP